MTWLDEAAVTGHLETHQETGKGLNPSATKTQPHKGMSAITPGLSIHPLPTHEDFGSSRGFPPHTSSIPACAHWKVVPASNVISPISWQKLAGRKSAPSSSGSFLPCQQVAQLPGR